MGEEEHNLPALVGWLCPSYSLDLGQARGVKAGGVPDCLRSGDFSQCRSVKAAMHAIVYLAASAQVTTLSCQSLYLVPTASEASENMLHTAARRTFPQYFIPPHVFS